jgi:PKD repeat protein
MKRTLLSIIAVLATVLVFAQAVPRNMVVLEIGTGTWCTYCPGAANAADQLISEGKSVAVIEDHNGDTYANTASNFRNSYYGITGYPTGHFDGILTFVGGASCPSGNVYANYLPLYNQRIAIPSVMNICMSGTNAGNNYTINVTLNKLGTITATDLRLHLVLTESHIVQSWQGCMTEVNFVERIMVPDYNGTSFNFTSGNVKNFTLNFTKDATWNAANCELVAFVQDNSTKEIFNGVKSALTTLPSAMLSLTDISGTPTTGCTPVPVAFSSVSTGVTTYSWTFPGGSPATGSTANPTVTYNSAGTFDVGLKVSNGVCKDSIGKSAYLTFSSAPLAPGTPVGNSALCANPGPQIYSTSGATGAVSYNWDLQPPAAGTLTPNGVTCTVNFSSSFTGTASLKVQGTNTCGPGAWSNVFTVMVSTQPSVPATPTGSTSICQDAPNTVYNTTGATPATSYTWEISPYTAGYLIPNGTSCAVDWSNTFTGTAELKVSAANNGCQGLWSANLDIEVNPSPQLFSITGSGTYCGTGGTGIAIGLDGSQTGLDYTLYLDGTATTTVVPGMNGPISFGNQMTAGSYTAIGQNTTTTCSLLMNGTSLVAVDPQAPLAPSTPNGPAVVHSGATPNSDYSTTGGTYATTYSWSLTPTDAGTIAGTGQTGTTSWNSAFIGTAIVKVQGVNTCGGGTFSDEYPVTVDNATAIHEATGAKLVSIWPNPAKGSLNIVPARTMNAGIRILNSLGSVVMEKNDLVISGQYKLDVSQLSPGVYFLTITGNDLQQVLKVVIE